MNLILTETKMYQRDIWWKSRKMTWADAKMCNITFPLLHHAATRHNANDIENKVPRIIDLNGTFWANWSWILCYIACVFLVQWLISQDWIQYVMIKITTQWNGCIKPVICSAWLKNVVVTQQLQKKLTTCFLFVPNCQYQPKLNVDILLLYPPFV